MKILKFKTCYKAEVTAPDRFGDLKTSYRNIYKGLGYVDGIVTETEEYYINTEKGFKQIEETNDGTYVVCK